MAKKTSKTIKNPVGRPPIFKTAPQMQKAIDEYFDSCWEEEWVYELKEELKGTPGGKKNIAPKTDDFYEWKPVLDRHGNVRRYQVKPYTINGLALALGMTRETLRDYQTKDKFSDTIKRAKQIVQEYAERQLYTPKIAAGVIFNLKNNYGWKDKHEVEHDATASLAALVAQTKGHDILGSAGNNKT